MQIFVIFQNFRANETDEQANIRKAKNNAQRREAWQEMPQPVKQKRIAAINAQKKFRHQAEDEITTADRQKFEAAQRKKLRSAP